MTVEPGGQAGRLQHNPRSREVSFHAYARPAPPVSNPLHGAAVVSLRPSAILQPAQGNFARKKFFCPDGRTAGGFQGGMNEEEAWKFIRGQAEAMEMK